MRRFNKITIIGVGLIGGSIGLAIKKRKLAGEVVGVFRHASTLKRAMRYKAVDRGVMDIKEGVKDAGLIIVASPVRSIPHLVKEAARWARQGAIITDAGSTKAWIVSNAEKSLKRFKNIYFVGSHPMAGSDHTGVEFARPDLLENAPCIVTKTKGVNKRALGIIAAFWRALGSKVSLMNPAEHDRHIAFISHLPHLVAYSIAGAVPEKDLAYAAEGFADTTRVASSDPSLWADIFVTNKRGVAESVRAFERYYKRIMRHLAKDDYKGIVKALADAKRRRDKLFYGK